MNLIKRKDYWDPLEMITDLQSEMNRTFNRSLTSRDSWPAGHYPNVEVREEDDAYHVHADLPGLKKEDLNISVEGNRLTLKGERKHEKEKKEKGYYYSERSFGAFARTLEFADDLQADKVKASYRDGVLEVVLPKSENAKPKQITVEVK